MAPAMPFKKSKKSKNGETSGKTHEFQVKSRVYLGSQWIHKNAYGRISSESSWRPYCRKRRQFTAALQFGTQIYSAVDKEWEKLEKIPAWDLTKVRSKKEMIDVARTSAWKFILPHWWHLSFEKRWIGGNGSYAVFTEQGSSASQMTAAKVMDIISRLPGCAGQAADAVSSYTQVKMEDAHKLLKIPKSECPDIWIRLPRHKWPKSWSSMKTQSFLSKGICMFILWQDYYGKGNLRKSYWNIAGRMFPIGNAYSYTVKKSCSYLCMWMTSNWLERKHWSDVESTQLRSRFVRTNIFPWSWKLGLHSKTMWKQAKIRWTITETCLNPGFPQSNWKITMLGKWISSWSYDMEDHAKKCVERYCELANRTTQQLYKVSTPCLDDHHFKEEELKSVGELSNTCSQIVLKCLYLARIGRPDILWSVISSHDPSQNGAKLVTNAWIDWFRIFIIRVNTNNIAMWVILLSNADWDCFRTLISREILKIQNLHQVEHCVFSEVIRLFQSVGCVRNELQFRTVQQNQKSFLWTQDWGWMESPHLIFGIWSSQFFTETRIRVIKNGDTRARA